MNLLLPPTPGSSTAQVSSARETFDHWLFPVVVSNASGAAGRDHHSSPARLPVIRRTGRNGFIDQTDRVRRRGERQLCAPHGAALPSRSSNRGIHLYRPARRLPLGRASEDSGQCSDRMGRTAAAAGGLEAAALPFSPLTSKDPIDPGRRVERQMQRVGSWHRILSKQRGIAPNWLFRRLLSLRCHELSESARSHADLPPSPNCM